MKRQFSALLLVGLLTLALSFASGTAPVSYTSAAENALPVEAFSSPIHLYAVQWEKDFFETPWMSGEVMSHSTPSIGAEGTVLSPFTFHPADRAGHSPFTGTYRPVRSERDHSVHYFIFALRKIRI